MKFKGSIEINQPKDIVTNHFANPENLKEWQEGFMKIETIKGTPGEDGSISKLFYKMGKREMELTETIIANRLPDTFEAFYHHKHMDNTMKCTFTALDSNRTLYENEVEYTRINWFLPKLMAILFPGVYKKQGHKWMVNFKNSVESAD